jgi:hypothetical protein
LCAQIDAVRQLLAPHTELLPELDSLSKRCRVLVGADSGTDEMCGICGEVTFNGDVAGDSLAAMTRQPMRIV